MIVVVGVFIGIQVSNWNDERESLITERAFIETVRNDIAQNIVDAQGFMDMLSNVLDHGRSSIATIEADAPCQNQCWARLIDFFIASQWIDVRTNQAMFDEIKRSGLPRDPALKATLGRYYGSTEQITIIGAQLPRYRELVRSIIPAAVQENMWQECIGIAGRHQIMIPDCPAKLSDAEASAIIEVLRADGEVKSSLTFWLSTVAVMIVGLEEQNAMGQAVIDAIEPHLTL